MTSEKRETGSKGYIEKKREMSGPRKVGVSGTIDIARHPRVATLELLLARHPFEHHPRAQKSSSSPHAFPVSRCLAPMKASMSRLLQFSRLSSCSDVRNETRTDDPRDVSINECIHITREIIITGIVRRYIFLSLLESAP